MNTKSKKDSSLFTGCAVLLFVGGILNLIFFFRTLDGAPGRMWPRVFLTLFLPVLFGALGALLLPLYREMRNSLRHNRMHVLRREKAGIIIVIVILSMASFNLWKSFEYSLRIERHSQLLSLHAQALAVARQDASVSRLSTDADDWAEALVNHEAIPNRIIGPALVVSRDTSEAAWDLDLRLLQDEALPKDREEVRCLVFAQYLRCKRGMTDWAIIRIAILTRDELSWRFVGRRVYETSYTKSSIKGDFGEANFPCAQVKRFLSALVQEVN